MKRVEIVWIDILSYDGWKDMDELDKYISDHNPVIQIGYIYEEDENHVVLLDSYFEQKDTYGGIHIIPRGCILSIKELKLCDI